jgi:hypothetical protein
MMSVFKFILENVMELGSGAERCSAGVSRFPEIATSSSEICVQDAIVANG